VSRCGFLGVAVTGRSGTNFYWEPEGHTLRTILGPRGEDQHEADEGPGIRIQPHGAVGGKGFEPITLHTFFGASSAHVGASETGHETTRGALQQFRFRLETAVLQKWLTL